RAPKSSVSFRRADPDKAFDSNAILIDLDAQGAKVVELKVWFESLTRRHPVPELSLPGFSFGRVRQVPHRAYMNGALSTHQWPTKTVANPSFR
ncbi:hypothetical protein ACO1KQ_14445, partial [Staphylococcus aureus]